MVSKSYTLVTFGGKKKRVSRLIIWSRETGSAFPSRVSLFISILRLNLVLTHGIPPEFGGGVHLFGRGGERVVGGKHS